MNIAEEMADCIIMLGQLHLIYGNANEVDTFAREKLDRTLARIREERKGMGDRGRGGD